MTKKKGKEGPDSQTRRQKFFWEKTSFLVMVDSWGPPFQMGPQEASYPPPSKKFLPPLLI